MPEDSDYDPGDYDQDHVGYSSGGSPSGGNNELGCFGTIFLTLLVVVISMFLFDTC